jgi:hypothetical protein
LGELTDGRRPRHLQGLSHAGVVGDHEPGTGARHGFAVRPLVGAEEREHDEWRPMGKRAERAPEASVADDHVGVSRDVVVRDPGLDVDVRRHLTEFGEVPIGVADGEQDPDLERGQRLDRRAIEGRVVRQMGAGRDRAEGEIDERTVVARPPVG